MADTTVTPYQYIENTGVIITDTSAMLLQVQTEWQNALGSDLIVTPDTPQGVMIAAETLARTNVVNNNAALANQINPNIAGGVFLDAIWALTGGQRAQQTNTLVQACTMAGVAGTFIPAGVQAKTSAGDIFISNSDVTLNGSGSGTSDFRASQPGPISCDTGELTIIFSGVIGWETITNPTPGILGTNTQSDQSARATRINTLAFQGLALPEAITSALYATAGVISLSFRENYNKVPMGLLTKVTAGATLANTFWGMTTTGGTGTAGGIIVGTDAINFAASTQSIPAINPWPTCEYTTTADITLSGLTVQGGGDWAATMAGGEIILVQNQTDATENGIWVSSSGAWTRQGFNINATTILGSALGIQVTANAVYACVQGGTDVDIAAALLENKSSGCGWNGNTTATVIEPASGQPYAVQFDRPTPKGILVKVTCSNVSEDNVKQAIIDYAQGLINGLAGFVVGADVSPFEISGAIMAENPGAYVSNVQISLSTGSPSFSTDPIPVGGNEIAQTQTSFITVIIVT